MDRCEGRRLSLAIHVRMIACQGISIQSIGKLLAGRLEPLEISLSIRSLAGSAYRDPRLIENAVFEPKFRKLLSGLVDRHKVF